MASPGYGKIAGAGKPRRVLIVSPHFPPSTLAGVHRARHLSRHLPEHGWEPTVLRVDPSHYTERNDWDLAAMLPQDLKQISVDALSARWMRRLGVGDIGIRAYGRLRSALLDALASDRADLVLITGSPFYPLCLSRDVKRVRPRIPVVLDFQDPWVSARPVPHALASKAGLSDRLARWLEPIALRGADAVTSVSAVQNSEMAGRYPWLELPMAAIPIGGDPDDFVAMRQSSRATTGSLLEPDLLHLSYVGTFLPRAEALVRTLFRALRLWQGRAPDLVSRVRLTFVGTSNQPNDTTSFRIMPIAREEAVDGLVREIPQRVPFMDALSLLAKSDGLLLIGSDERHYTASKIYPALMSGTPYLSLFHSESSADAILRKAGGGQAFSFATTAQLEALIPELAGGLARLVTGHGDHTPADPSAYADVTARAVAGQFARLFDTLLLRS